MPPRRPVLFSGIQSAPIPVYIGIDPGASGGIAFLQDGPPAYSEASLTPMPETERDVWMWITSEWVSDSNEEVKRFTPFAVIEKVHAMPGNGVSGMFKFGMSYGGLRMALIAAGIPFEDVTPQHWQKALGVPKRDKQESQTEFKNRLKAKAQQLYPNVKVTLATADALLIATYCQRLREGKLN